MLIDFFFILPPFRYRKKQQFFNKKGINKHLFYSCYCYIYEYILHIYTSIEICPTHAIKYEQYGEGTIINQDLQDTEGQNHRTRGSKLCSSHAERCCTSLEFVLFSHSEYNLIPFPCKCKVFKDIFSILPRGPHMLWSMCSL